MDLVNTFCIHVKIRYAQRLTFNLEFVLQLCYTEFAGKAQNSGIVLLFSAVFLFMEATRSGVVGVGVTRRAGWELEDALVHAPVPHQKMVEIAANSSKTTATNQLGVPDLNVVDQDQ